MKKILSTLLAVGCALGVSADVILERFDSPERVAGKILPAGKAQILLEGGTEKAVCMPKASSNLSSTFMPVRSRANPAINSLWL